ncbi:MAG: hypothetical protein AVDCRST_MAG17-1940, partial [uncultured Solirubrobacterales bacterium]
GVQAREARQHGMVGHGRLGAARHLHAPAVVHHGPREPQLEDPGRARRSGRRRLQRLAVIRRPAVLPPALLPGPVRARLDRRPRASGRMEPRRGHGDLRSSRAHSRPAQRDHPRPAGDGGDLSLLGLPGRHLRFRRDPRDRRDARSQGAQEAAARRL